MCVSATKHSELAIRGGQPVRNMFLPYSRQSIEASDVEAVVAVLRSDWLTTGRRVQELEEAFAAYVGAKHAVSFSSGTAALHGAVFAAGLKSGDEGITSPLSFVATANCVLYQGARPFFADVLPGTLTLNPEQVAEVVTSRTRVILPVAYAGHPAEMDAILDSASRHNVMLVEDASHALGAMYHGRSCGSVAHMTTFSFHLVKHIAAGEGGMVTTDYPSLAQSLRSFRNHGIDSDAAQRRAAGTWYYEMNILGFNYRLSDIACALALSQLGRIEANLARRRIIAERFNEAFRSLSGITIPVVAEGVKPAWHLYPIRLNLEKLTVGRAEIFRALRAENIGVNVHYIPIHLHPFYRKQFGYVGGEYPIAENAYERLLSLPMFHGMTDADIEDVIEAVRKVLAAYSR